METERDIQQFFSQSLIYLETEITLDNKGIQKKGPSDLGIANM